MWRRKRMMHGAQGAGLRILVEQWEIHHPKEVMSSFRDEMQPLRDVLADPIQRRIRDPVRAGDVERQRALRNTECFRCAFAEEFCRGAIQARSGALEANESPRPRGLGDGFDLV